MAMAGVLAGAQLGVSAWSTLNQVNEASATANMQDQLLRDQQTQLRIAQASRSVDRMTQLQHVMAAQEVTGGARGSAPSSGSLQAVTEESYNNAENDQRTDTLNFMNQQNNLEYEEEGVNERKEGEDLSALSDFGRNTMNLGFRYERIPGSGLMDSAGGDSSGWESEGASSMNLNN